MKKRIEIFDTTLRDGSQSENISYSLADKLAIAKELDSFGVDYIEGGWPGSNPKDVEFFKEVKKLNLKTSKICAFGSTRHTKNTPENDPNLKALVESGAATFVIFGKSWDFQVKEALKVSLEENLLMIESSIKYLSKFGDVIYDAEHFFDGFMSNSNYARETVTTAAKAGAKVIVFCDTNGGTLPHNIASITKSAKDDIFHVSKKIRIGIHPHNDCGLAVANALAAVEAGATHVQGTINGFGERCGNVDLIPVIANLKLKLGYNCCNDSLDQLTSLSKKVYEISNIVPRDNQPYVGKSAFAHKGGIHVSAVARNSATYEHINPSLVGNETRVLVSELSGKSNILAFDKKNGNKFGLKDNHEKLNQIVSRVSKLEAEGYSFESADASLDVLIHEILGKESFAFVRLDINTCDYHTFEEGKSLNEATIKLLLKRNSSKYQKYSFSGEGKGNGPVNALDIALRNALENDYPEVKDIKLIDYKVKTINQEDKTAAKVLVSITSTNGTNTWTTIGVNTNIIKASLSALMDSMKYIILNRNTGE